MALCSQILHDNGFPTEFSLDPSSYINKLLHVKAYKLLRIKLFDHWDNGGTIVSIPPPTGGESWITEQIELEQERKRFEEKGLNVAGFVSKVETDYYSDSSDNSDGDDRLVLNLDNISFNQFPT